MKLAYHSLLLIFILNLPNFAATIDWNNTSTDFNANGSWTGGTAPGASDIAQFSATPTIQPQLTGNISLDGIQFDAGGFIFGSNSSTNIITLGSSGFNFTNSGTNTGTFNANLEIAQDQNLQVEYQETLYFGGFLSGSGNLVRTGTGIVEFTKAGAHSFSGALTLNKGTTKFTNNSFSVSEFKAGTSSNVATVEMINTSINVTTNNDTIRLGTGTPDSTITMTGTSSLQVDVNGANIDIGRSGGGKMTVTLQNGADINHGHTSDNIYIGNLTDGYGELIIDGSGSSTSAGTLRVGSRGNGALTIQNGGEVTVTNDFHIAREEIASGQVTVTGSGSSLSVTSSRSVIGAVIDTNSDTIVGPAVKAELHIDNGASVTFNGELDIKDSGILELDNGTINITGDFLTRTGSYIRGNGTITKDFSMNGKFSNNAGEILNIDGKLSGSGIVTKEGNGELKLIGTLDNTYSGGTTVSAGTLGLGKTDGTNALPNYNATVESGATLKWYANNQLHNSADITLNGGTLDLNDYNEGSTSTDGIDNLIITENAFINMTGVGDIFRFTDDTGSTSGKTLTINYWGGNPNGTHGTGSSSNTGDRFLFENPSNAGTASADLQVLTRSNITFAGWGTGSKILSVGAGLYELVPDVNTITWDAGGASGDWDTGTNWVGDTVANGANSVVLFDATGNSQTSITLTSSKTLGQIIIEDSNYTISNQTITLDGNGGSGISVLDSSLTNSISSTISLSDDAVFNVASNSQLTISGAIDGASKSLTKTGAGTLILSNNNTYTGNTTVTTGTLNLTGSIDGNLVVNGGSVTGGTNANAVASALTMSSGTITANSDNNTGKFNITGGGTNSWTGGTYIWNVNGGMGSSGTDTDGNGYYEASGTDNGSLYDILAFTGALDFTGASAGAITIQIDSQSTYTGYQWETPTEIKIVTYGSIINFNESYFNLDASSFNDATGSWWLNWGITSHNNALWLTYEAVPEPSTWIIIGLLGLLLPYAYYKKKHKPELCSGK